MFMPQAAKCLQNDYGLANAAVPSSVSRDAKCFCCLHMQLR